MCQEGGCGLAGDILQKVGDDGRTEESGILRKGKEQRNDTSG